MATVDRSKTVARQIAKSREHKMKRFKRIGRRPDDGWQARCVQCDRFVIVSFRGAIDFSNMGNGPCRGEIQIDARKQATFLT